MFRLLVLFILQLGYAFAVETLFVGNEDSYEVLSFSEYSAVENMNDVPADIKNNIWYKNKFDFELNTDHQAYWVKIKVKNSENISKELFLMDERRYLYALEYYLVKNGKVSTYIKDGYYVRENVSSFNSNQRILPLTLDKNEEATLLFKIQNYNMLDMPLKIVNKAYIAEYFQVYSFLQGAFFAVLFVMVIYNLIIYLIVQFRAYLYYLAYVFLLTIYQSAYFGYLRLLNMPPEVTLSLMMIGGMGFIVFAVFFIKELFHLKKYLPRIDKAFSVIIGYMIVLILIDIISVYLRNFYLSQLVFNMVSIVIPIYVSMLLYALYYLSYKKVNKVVLVYSILWSIISLLGLLLIAMHAGFISINLGVDYLFQAGMFVETILFSLMLAYNIKEIEEEKKEQQLMLIQQNRLASMGEMISTIAHQWRQPLSIINGRVLGLDIDYRNNKLTDSIMEEHLSDIENTTAYMSEIINDFMNFFNSKKKLEEFLLSDIMGESIRIIKMSSLKKVEIRYKLNDIHLTGYKSELTQAILIVINNGIDAYAGTGIAKIDIEVKEEGEKEVQIIIKDNGSGISEEVLFHIFEPYYTTKHKSQGTGLGLYILKMIVENGMGGRASIENDINGAVFTISIPKIIS